jgi:hypothetical protein
MVTRFFLATIFVFGNITGALAEHWPIKKGQVFYKARPALLRQGWRPVAVYKSNEFDLIGDGIRFYRHGFKEVESCSQGRGYCSFHYRKGDQCLMLVTQGEYIPPNSPKLDKWLTYPAPGKNEKPRMLSTCSDEASSKASDGNKIREY